MTSKDETMVLLTQSGFTDEFLNLSNRHRACQCIMIHSVFKIRREASWSSCDRAWNVCP